MARWQVATAAALLMLAACASAQPFTLTTGASVTTSLTTLPASGTNVVVRFTAYKPLTETSGLSPTHPCCHMLSFVCSDKHGPDLGKYT